MLIISDPSQDQSKPPLFDGEFQQGAATFWDANVTATFVPTWLVGFVVQTLKVTRQLFNTKGAIHEGLKSLPTTSFFQYLRRSIRPHAS